MALSSGPNLGILVSGNQGEQHYAEMLRFFRGVDALVQPHAKDKDLTAPPGSPADGDLYIVGASATGAWATHDGKLARWNSGGSAWEFITPREGWVLWLEDEDVPYRYTGSAWALESTIDKRRTATAVTSSAGALTLNYALGDYFTLALSENVTSISISNLPGAGKGCTIMVRITQDSTPRTVAWPASFKWAGGSAGAVSTGSGDVDVLALTTFDNGTTWFVTLAKDYS